MCCLFVFEFSVGIGGFVIGLSQISFFFSLTVAVQRVRLEKRGVASSIPTRNMNFQFELFAYFTFTER